MDHHVSTVVVAVASFLAGGLLAEFVGDVVAPITAVSVLVAAMGRYAAVLRDATKREVERRTAQGFLIGFALGVVVVVVDATVGA